MILNIGRTKHDVRDLAEARATYIRYRDAQMLAGKGSSQSHFGKIKVGRDNYEISWNGNVWSVDGDRVLLTDAEIAKIGD